MLWSMLGACGSVVPNLVMPSLIAYFFSTPLILDFFFSLVTFGTKFFGLKRVDITQQVKVVLLCHLIMQHDCTKHTQTSWDLMRQSC